MIIYNSISYKCFYGFGDMLIGSKIPPQADIIKFVIAGGDPRVAGCGAVCQAKMGHRKSRSATTKSRRGRVQWPWASFRKILLI